MRLPVGWQLRRVATTRSTNADLVAEAERGAAEGVALLADAQTAGRGRQGRVWQSPPGNLYLSVILRPGCDPAAVGQIGILAALAVADLLGGLGVAAQLKWPNDVLVDGAKVAGVLVETGLAHGRVDFAVAGIGLNVAWHPDDVGYPATSLAALAHHASPTPVACDLAALLLNHLAARYASWRAHGFAPLRAAWCARGPVPGTEVRVRVGPTLIDGRYRDLDPDGALVLEVSPGQHRRVMAGDLLAN